MTSKAEIMLETNCMTLVKLSSPILQEPSMRKTTSALAPLHTGGDEKKSKCNQTRTKTLSVFQQQGAGGG